MDRRFTALRVIGTVFKILAWVSLIIGLLGAVGLLIVGITVGSGETGPLGLNIEGGPLAGVAAFVGALIIAIIYFLIFYAAGESIYLFLSIEESTRRTAYFMQQQYTPQQSAYPVPAPPRGYRE